MIPLAPAVPVDDIPVAPAVPLDQVPDATPAPAARPQDQDGDIRLSPSTVNGEETAKAALSLANNVFARKMYDYAIEEYEKFLISFPSAQGRDMAMFRLAECHRMLGNEQPARIGYENLLMEFREESLPGRPLIGLGNTCWPKRNTIRRSFNFASRRPRRPATKSSCRPNTIWPSAWTGLTRRLRPPKFTPKSRRWIKIIRIATMPS